VCVCVCVCVCIHIYQVLRNPVPIQSDHLAAFQLVLGDIARPTQPLNGRVIEEASRF
jgi:carbonic anhydrase